MGQSNGRTKATDLIGSKRARGISSLTLNNKFIYGLGLWTCPHNFLVVIITSNQMSV